MSSTRNILKGVKVLVDKIKQKDEKTKNKDSANTALINNLLQMESAYKVNVNASEPDYSNVYSTDTRPTLQIKDDNALKGEAAKYVSELVANNTKKVMETTQNKLDKLKLSQVTATDHQRESLQKMGETFESRKEGIKDATIRQGLANSSIKGSWLDDNIRGYISAVDIIKNEYKEKLSNLDTQMTLVKSAKEQSLYDYNLKVASEYEKKLAKLQDEQIKIMGKLNSYENKTSAIKFDAGNGNGQFRFDGVLQEEEQEGYTGETAIEMENRYKKALAFYGEMDSKKAIGLIEENKEELKEALGLYYIRLINDINK